MLFDLSKAYNSVNGEALMAVLRKYGVPGHAVSLVEQMHAGMWCWERWKVKYPNSLRCRQEYDRGVSYPSSFSTATWITS